jgi:transposase
VGDLIGRSLAASNVGLAELGSEIIVRRREIDRVNVKDPARGMPAQSVLNAAWGQLISFTDYKAANAGGLVAKVDPRGTSQECDGCGWLTPKYRSGESPIRGLNDRLHDCLGCGSRRLRGKNRPASSNPVVKVAQSRL